MVVLNVVMITLGQVGAPITNSQVSLIELRQVIAYGIDAGFADVSGGWRWMVGLGSVPAALQVFFLFFLPESRWYHFDLNNARVLTVRCSTNPRPKRQRRSGLQNNDQNICSRKA